MLQTTCYVNTGWGFLDTLGFLASWIGLGFDPDSLPGGRVASYPC